MELKNQVIKSCLSKTKMLPFHSNIPAKSKPYSKYFSTSICTAKHFSGQTFHETVPLCSGRIPRPHGLLYFLVFCPSSYRVVSPADPGILDHSPRGNVGKQGLSLLECLYIVHYTVPSFIRKIVHWAHCCTVLLYSFHLSPPN